MSDATKAALDEAIRLHVADECEERVVVAYNLVVAAVAMESYGNGSAYYARWAAEGQQLHVTAGLSDFTNRMIAEQWAEPYSQEDDE